MESDTKKRGRPAVASPIFKAVFYDMQGRALTNMVYVAEAQRILSESWGMDRFKETFSKSTGKFKYQSVLEQIGRMSAQNGYNDESCIEIAELALKMLDHGYKVKAVSDWIRHGRNTNEW